MRERLLKTLTDDLVSAMEPLRFGEPVAYVYNPLVYARHVHDTYIDRFAGAPIEALFLGMNPGPWGMAQTGIPFGDPEAVQGWMGIEAPVGKPIREHPKRRITGFAKPRGEVSGRRLWSWAHEQFGAPERFFERFFVANYCPLAFMEESGRNRTPDKLPRTEREPLFEACDRYLVAMVEALAPQHVIGVGVFAERRAKMALEAVGIQTHVGRILHPSPASPAANRGWSALATADLTAAGIEI